MNEATVAARRRRLRDDSGQAFVEMLLIVPLAVFLLLGTVDLAKCVSYWLDSSHLANEAARFAVVGTCPGGGTCDANTLATAIRNQAETGQLKGDTTVCVTPNANSVKVTVHSPYNFISTLGLGSITITGKSVMRLEGITVGSGQAGTGSCP